MKLKTKIIGAVLVACSVGASIVYANGGNTRIPVEFFHGHTHESDGTQGAPSHSGGLDRQGCHNGSVPYHCH